jgi:dTDP-4-amino-4,6-dideoxygalactose transaminase
MEAPDLTLPVTDACVKRIFSIPMHPKLTDEQVHYIADNVKGGLK